MAIKKTLLIPLIQFAAPRPKRVYELYFQAGVDVLNLKQKIIKRLKESLSK